MDQIILVMCTVLWVENQSLGDLHNTRQKTSQTWIDYCKKKVNDCNIRVDTESWKNLSLYTVTQSNRKENWISSTFFFVCSEGSC